jgi:hypothetical protein
MLQHVISTATLPVIITSTVQSWLSQGFCDEECENHFTSHSKIGIEGPIHFVFAHSINNIS